MPIEKVEEFIQRKFMKVKGIRLYPKIKGTIYNVNSTVERKEKPTLLSKLAWSHSRDQLEIEIVFMGQYHVEELAYFKKPPDQWSSWGEIVLSLDQALELEKILHKLLFEEEKVTA